MRPAELDARLKRALASKWATEPWVDPRRAPKPSAERRQDRVAGARSSAARTTPPSRAEHARLVRKAVTLNPWLSTELAEVVAEAWSKMLPAPPASSRPPRRRRKGKRGRVRVRYECPVCGGPHSRADHREAA